MITDEEYRFAGITCFVHSYGLTDNNSLWRWMADPYRIEKNQWIKPDIALEFTKESYRPDYWIPVQTLKKEDGINFIKIVERSNCGGTIWSYVRKKTMESVLEFYVPANKSSICLKKDITNSCGVMAFAYMGQIFPYLALFKGMMTFHGVLMEDNDRGIIISAPSGTGKTTHARLWREYNNSLIINGDRAACSFINGHWIGHGLPWSGSSGEQINRSVNITAIVILQQDEINKAERLNGWEAFTALMPNVLYPSWDQESTEIALDMLENFLSCIPVFSLRCRPDIGAVEALEHALEEL